jgi:hypothetical protein
MVLTNIKAYWQVFKLPFSNCSVNAWAPPGQENPARDPIVFVRTTDMADTSKWQRIPAEFDKNQAKAYSFAPPDHSTGRVSDRSSGLGPAHARPP